MSRKKKIVLFSLIVASIACAAGCAHISETDGKKSFALFSYSEDRKGRHESTIGRGGWFHSPASSSISGGPSAALRGAMGGD